MVQRPLIIVKLSFRELGCLKLSACNVCNPHCKLICRKKWHLATSETSTSPETTVEKHFHSRHGTNTIPIFSSSDGEASWSLFPSSVSLLSGRTVQLENTYSCIFKVTSQLWESQKIISIDTSHSYHQRSSPEASLHWSSNKIRFSFQQAIRKRWGASSK